MAIALLISVLLNLALIVTVFVAMRRTPFEKPVLDARQSENVKYVNDKTRIIIEYLEDAAAALLYNSKLVQDGSRYTSKAVWIIEDTTVGLMQKLESTKPEHELRLRQEEAA